MEPSCLHFTTPRTYLPYLGSNCHDSASIHCFHPLQFTPNTAATTGPIDIMLTANNFKRRKLAHVTFTKSEQVPRALPNGLLNATPLTEQHTTMWVSSIISELSVTSLVPTEMLATRLCFDCQPSFETKVLKFVFSLDTVRRGVTAPIMLCRRECCV